MPRKAKETTVPIIDVPIYNIEIAVFRKTPKTSSKQFQELFGQEPPAPFEHCNGMAMMLSFAKGREVCAVYLAPRASHGEIAHEALHLAHFILNRAQVQCGPENDEAIAYLVTYITDEIHRIGK